MRKHLLVAMIFCLGFGMMAIAQDRTIVTTKKSFWVQSAMNYGKNPGGCWDIPGKPTKIENNANIQVWTIDAGDDRKIRLEETKTPGYYRIKIGKSSYSNKQRLVIQGGKRNATTNSANIATWSVNNLPEQEFRLKHLGGGKFKIYTKAGMVVCLASRKNTNGTNVHIWEDHDGPWMEWYLVDPTTKKAYNPDAAPKTPTFLTDNYIEFKESYNTDYKEGKVINVTYNKPIVKVEVLLLRQGGNGPEVKKISIKKTYSFYYANGIYYYKKYDEGAFVGYRQCKVSKDNALGIRLGETEMFGYFTIGNAPYPLYFKNNKDKTFKYKENLAFVEGGEGTAVVKEVTDSKVVMLVTSKKRNQQTGKFETRTFDYTILYKNGKYTGTDDSYPEVGNVITNANGKKKFALDGEQSSVNFWVE